MSEIDHRIEESAKTGVPTIPQLVVAFSILGAIMGSSYLPFFNEAEQVREAPQSGDVATVPVSKGSSPTAFEDIKIYADAVYVWDVTKQRSLYKKNPDAQLPLASLTKLMTALVAREVLDTPGEQVDITLDAISQEGESGFNDGDAWNVQALLEYTLITSSNDGAYALAAAAGAALTEEPDVTDAFVAAMNVRAEQLGLAQTYYTNPTGLDESESQSGSYGSARDMAFLMEYILTRYPEILEKTAETGARVTNENGAIYVATNTNQAVTDVPGIMGSKTGYTLLAGGNLVIAFDAGLNRPVIISVLGSTRDGRFSDVLALVKASQEAIVNETSI